MSRRLAERIETAERGDVRRNESRAEVVEHRAAGERVAKLGRGRYVSFAEAGLL